MPHGPCLRRIILTVKIKDTHTGSASKPASKHASDPLILQVDAQRYWEGVLGRLTKPTAKALADMLDLSQPLGLPKPPPGTPRRKSPPMLAKFKEFKAQHPTKALLVRVRRLGVGSRRGVASFADVGCKGRGPCSSIT